MDEQENSDDNSSDNVSRSSSQVFSPPSSPVPTKRTQRRRQQHLVNINEAVTLPSHFPEASPEASCYQLQYESSSSSSCAGREEESSVAGEVSDCGSLSDVDEGSCEAEGESSESNSDIDDDHLPLFHGCVKSKDEAVVDLLQLFIDNRWTKVSLQGALIFLNIYLPSDHKMPSTVHFLLKYVEDLAPQVKDIEHFYCVDCLLPLDSSISLCSKCLKSNSNKFFEVPLESLIKYYFEQSDLSEVLDKYRHVSEHPNIKDLQDGEEFKKVEILCDGQYDLTLIWNTDGVQLSESSSVSMWPIQAVICEVPLHLRKKFTLLCGLWVDKCKPKTELFLKPFCDSLVKLWKNGVEWRQPRSRQMITSKVVAPILSADAPAKAEVLNVQYFSAKYGCNVCEQKAVQVKSCEGKKIRRFVYDKEGATIRTHERVQRQALKAERSGKSIRGVKGQSPVSDIPFFNLGSSAVTDYMHCVLLGCVFRFIHIWFCIRGPWFLDKKARQVIDKFLPNDVKVPDFVSRLPRGVSQYKMWKASELRTWLLFCCLPAFRLAGMALCYIEHFSLLVSAIFILLQEVITPEDLNTAEEQLNCFVRDVGVLYSLKDYTYNMHNLIHLPLCVRRYGPLFVTSAFHFEDANGVLAHLIHGTKHMGREVMNKASGFQVLCCRVRQLCDTTTPQQNSSCLVLGSPVSNNKLSCEESTALSRAGVASFQLYKRVKSVKGIITSSFYDKQFKRVNSFVSYESNSRVLTCGKIIHFVRDLEGGEILCLIKPLKTEHSKIFYTHRTAGTIRKITHIVPIFEKEESELGVINVQCVKEKLLKVGSFLCRRPNVYENNL